MLVPVVQVVRVELAERKNLVALSLEKFFLAEENLFSAAAVIKIIIGQ